MSKIKHVWTIVLGLLCCAPLAGMAQMSLEWVKPVSGTGGEILTTSMTFDKDENIYTIGYFLDSIEVPTKSGTQKIKAVSNGIRSLFIMKADPSGAVEWIKGISGAANMGGGVTTDRATGDFFAIKSDQNGNLYITGAFTGTIDFDPGPGQALKTAQAQFAGQTNTFILKLNKDGEFKWVRAFVGGRNGANDIALDEKNGTICVTGFFQNKTEFNDGGSSNAYTAAANAQNIYLAKYDTSGNFVWVKQMGNAVISTVNRGNRIVIDDKGYIYATGIFVDTIDFDPGPGTAKLGSFVSGFFRTQHIFVLKYDAAGNYVWAKSGGGEANQTPSECFGLTRDNMGNIYVTGYFQTAVNFDPARNAANKLTAASGGLSYFLYKLDSSGNYSWGKAFGRLANPAKTDAGFSVQTDDKGNVYTCGYFMDRIYLDPNPGSSREVFQSGTASPDAFVLKLDANGIFVWAKQFKSATPAGQTTPAGQSLARCVSLSPYSNNIYVLGGFLGITDFNPKEPSLKINSANPTTFDGYLAKLACLDTSSSVLTVDTCGTQYTYLGKTYTQSGTYQAKVPNAAGCDSTITLKLTLKAPSTYTNNVSICGTQYVYLDKTYTKSGTYQEVLKNAAGCDSTITLNLTLKSPTTYTNNVSICGTQYVYLGKTYTKSGTYQEVLKNAAGCDSTITLNLTLKSSTTYTNNVSICSTQYVYLGKTYTQSGTYQEKITNAAGCDSNITLNLTLKSSTSFVNNVEVCGDQYIYLGKTYTQSGTYQEKIPNVAGCDSNITLNLTLKPATGFVNNVEVCGDRYVYLDKTYTESGDYQDTLQNAAGCDSIITLSLTLKALPEPEISFSEFVLSTGRFEAYQWLLKNEIIPGANEQSYTVKEKGDYSVVVTTAENCADTSDVYKVTEDPSGIEEAIRAREVTIYPNPTDGVIYIASPVPLTAFLTGIEGKELISRERVQQISIGHLPCGLYLLKLFDVKGNLIKVEKIVRK